MLFQIIKYVCLALLAALILSAPAEACERIDDESTVYFGAMPTAGPDIDPATNFIGDVSLHTLRDAEPEASTEQLLNYDVGPQIFTAYVHDSTTHPELVGTLIDVARIKGTSCGPWMDTGDRGFISATINQRDDTRLFVTPKSHGSLWRKFVDLSKTDAE